MFRSEEHRFILILPHHDQRDADSGCQEMPAEVVAPVISGESQLVEFARAPCESVVLDGNQSRTFGRIHPDSSLRREPAELLRAENKSGQRSLVRLPLL